MRKRMNWKALLYSLLSVSGFVLFVVLASWISVNFGVEYFLLPLTVIGGIVLFYLAYDGGIE